VEEGGAGAEPFCAACSDTILFFLDMTLPEDAAASSGLPKFISDLEADLQKNSDNLEVREQLIDYYYEQLVRSDADWGGALHEAWSQHVYWVIQHRPESRLAGSATAMVQPPCGTEEDYEKGKQLWVEQTELHGNEPTVLLNAAHYLRRNDAVTAQALLERADSIKPRDPDIGRLLCGVYRRNRACSEMFESEKDELAQKALVFGEQSLDASPIDRFYRLGDVAEAAFEAAIYGKAEAYTRELLASAPRYESNWNYGNAVHKGNLLLGRLALRVGDLVSASEYLLKAGETRGSPQLNSFGPNMTLAKELIENGQREAVIRYFDLCAKFWGTGQDRLRSWRWEVEQGRTPDFTS
jgi:tetratricopeptide (TPR) repeat protein